MEKTVAPGALTNGELLYAGGESAFKDLGIGDSRIGHVCVDSGRTIAKTVRACTPTDRLVVAKIRVPEEGVIHRALTCRRDPKDT